MKKNNYKVLIGRGITFINLKNGTKIKGSAISRKYSLSNIKKQINSPKPLVQKLNKQLESEQNDIKNIISSTISSLEFYDVLNTPSNEEYESEPKKKKKRRKKEENEKFKANIMENTQLNTIVKYLETQDEKLNKLLEKSNTSNESLEINNLTKNLITLNKNYKDYMYSLKLFLKYIKEVKTKLLDVSEKIPAEIH